MGSRTQTAKVQLISWRVPVVCSYPAKMQLFSLTGAQLDDLSENNCTFASGSLVHD
jgi:hypothetical protein